MIQEMTITSKVSGAKAILYIATDGRYSAICYPSKRAKKPVYFGFCNSKEERRERLTRWFKQMDAEEVIKQTHNRERNERKRQERENAEEGFKVGDVIYNSWGYEQTNVDFYLIVGRTKTMVDLQPIGQSRGEDYGWMTGTCIPDPEHKLDKPVERHKICVWGGKEQSISFKHGSGSKWDGKPVHWSAYH